ncbi:MAG TPA: aldose 1-epimerase [Leptospiraceae bacterium]|nr:aldose 1-epimerase [Leptospiraceae bacterium]HMY68118.1 aldose 1-epimerase [Leptospiraceae bacterium]HNF25132.1 aldose 1-epimerase [Leptospiraceae bacterium]HNH07763.1 aldose 1-epimerase [Leptospiraceae bacterium]HNI97901.1 aldose 1-epimerase [Leptospiraceae bacterium]
MVIRTESSFLELDLQNGGRILCLELISLKGRRRKVIWADPALDFFFSGSFLMFPWVNRLESDRFNINGNRIEIEPVLKDEAGYPIHGLYFKSERRCVSVSEGIESSEIIIEPIQTDSLFPSFRETFSLERSRLTVSLEVFGSSDKEMYFSAGYHPYIGLEGRPIDSLEIISNCTETVLLGDDLLPETPIRKKPFKSAVQTGKIDTLKLDHCFTGNSSHPYFGIFDRTENEKVILEIHRSFNPSVFFQIYTPPHRQSIAVEPMSSLGNSFSEKNGTHSSIKKNDIKVFSFSVRLE